MKHVSLGAGLLALATLAACGDATQDAVAPKLGGPVAVRAATATEDVMPGEVIVKVRDGVDVASVAAAHGLSFGEHGPGKRFAVLHGAAGAEHGKAKELASDPRVVYAEPNFLRHTTAIDPRLWAFYNPGGLNMKFTSGSSSGQPIGAAYASTADADEDNIAGYAASGSDVVVGSIDTGVDMAHVEFTGRLIAGKDWYNNDANPTDDDGHGSHTTGTMAGTTVGVAGISGAAPHVKVYVQKVCGRRGCPTTAIVSAIYAAADYPGMVAMNLSIGGTGESQSEKDAILYATNKNVLVIASAGNAGTGTVECPACDPNAISVSATQWQDKLASYSSWGPGLDISAPGGNCYSNTTSDGCIYSAYKNGGYSWMQGTSMAAPQVTGAAGVVASVTGLRGSALRARLIGTVDDLGAAGYDTSFGAGRLNVYRAVTNTSLPAGQ
ncbi:MAG TPA: S8 family serine peptidase [Longimicrobiaceae bacterium]|nr:S8 family serine peptidase [Longimicrobiaceae bacterium]